MISRSLPALRRFLPIVILVTALVAIRLSGVADWLSWAGLARDRGVILAWVADHPAGAPALYVAIYTLSTALSLPQAVILTIAGGLLFGTLPGAALAVCGATAGATVLFLAARSALGESMRTRGGATVTRVRAALERDGFRYLLAIRLVPAFPFWMVNLAASICGMRLADFVAATFLGVIPGTVIFASVGAGLGDILAAGGAPDLSVIFTLPILGPLIGLALLSLASILWKRRKPADA